MDLRLFMTVFMTIFLAEIADKTQVATLLYASNSQHDKLSVFMGSAFALVLASAIAVFVGSSITHLINQKYISWAAGIAFILVGIWTLAKV